MALIHCILLCLLAVPTWGQATNANTKCSKGYQWYDDGLIINADETHGQCVKWKDQPEEDGRRCYICESGHCGGCIKRIPPPVPLACGKYQHVYHWPGACGPASCNADTMVCNASCSPLPPDRCVDDMHEVTEREWQELNERLKMLHSEVVCATMTELRCGRTDAWDRKMEKGIK